ncbi:hypothetical protein FRB94_014547 [Tulasnella sp. JGI-2019a]|nr:hypothetical protein FRB93_011004 [Tulasnella sp. JGI-2019a]KAG9007164.1 hypothetical protein FRB94_014547 [Tulasnella sp. JGI-2019a]KAG9032364.1 hypothetical protein FRB95_001546 [Tulasnella sp. JGI-2019a]
MYFSQSLFFLSLIATAISLSSGKHNHHSHSHKRRGPSDAGQTSPATTLAPRSTAWWTSSAKPTGSKKWVFAHFIVGNAYSYTDAQWSNEIRSAAAQGIDAFILNLGTDSWQPAQVDRAYTAAAHNGFHMFFSFDMTVISCSDTTIIPGNIAKYANHPAQLKDSNGASFVTTFNGGAGCKDNAQWMEVVKNSGIQTKFVPAFFDDLTSVTLKSVYNSINGDTLWGGAWPKGNNPIDWSEDNYRISRNGLQRPTPDFYMTTVAPHFHVHWPGRNYIWRFDDHLYVSRWQLLVQKRALVDAAEIISWNDYGESTYIGPIGKDLPAGSSSWVTGFDHTAFLAMTGYWTSYFKTGKAPTIIHDKIFIWGRPHGVNDSPTQGDAAGRPQNADWVSDKLWIVLFSTGAGTLQVTQGSSSSTYQVVGGVNKLSMPLGVANDATAVLTRHGHQVFHFNALIAFSHSTPHYNFNTRVASGP